MLDIRKIVGRKSDLQPASIETRLNLTAEQKVELDSVMEELRQDDEQNDLDYFTTQIIASLLNDRIETRRKDAERDAREAAKAERKERKGTKLTSVPKSRAA